MSRARTVALALLMLLPWPAGARETVAVAPKPQAQLVLTVSGGVSLGAYEAGVLYYLLETARLNPGLLELRAATGASAGSLNSLLSILSACGASAQRPDESVFWQTWIPLGLHQLYVPEDVKVLGALSRPALERAARQVEAAWNGGISESCDVVLGVSTTRLEPRTVRVASERVELPRMEEKWAVRIRGRGAGRPPLATNYLIPGSPFGARALVTDADGAVPFSAIRDLLLASMAFPVAFPPVPLASCAARPEDDGRCSPASAETSLFVDGGVLDNTPLRLAVGLVGAGLRSGADGQLAWRDRASGQSGDVPGNVYFAFLAPDLADHPTYEPKDTSDVTHSLVSLLARFAGGFILTARSKELTAVIEERPELFTRMVPPQRHYPAASAPLGAFLGFMERDFRLFDFYLGMYDARRTYEDALRSRVELAGPSGTFAYPEPRAAGGEVAGGWQPFLCLRAVFDGAGAPEEACAGPELRGFRILARTALETLYSTCRLVPEGGQSSEPCQRARAGEEPPAVPGVDPVPWERTRSESELTYRLRLLAAHRFAFTDLGLRPDQADQALTRIRAEVGAIAARVAEVQPRDDRPLVELGVKAAADAIAYRAPDRIVHLTLGPVAELGWSQTLPGLAPRPGTLRFDAAIGFRGLERLASSSENVWAVSALAGVEVQPTWGQTLSQLRFGLRAGYEFASRDGLATRACDAVGSADPGACSRWLAQALVGVSVLERLRLQLVGSWYPPLRSGERTVWSISPGFGLEYGF